MSEINWPEAYRPDATAVHVRNELLIQAPPQRVWAWLVRARSWPDWYENARNVEIEGGGDELHPGARFRWTTFGLAIESVVGEFVPFERIGWTGVGTGMDVYHGWLIEPRDDGCRVLTAENQNGLAARAQSVLAPHRMHKYHQVWLEGLKARAEESMPSRLCRDGGRGRRPSRSRPTGSRTFDRSSGRCAAGSRGLTDNGCGRPGMAVMPRSETECGGRARKRTPHVA